MDERNTKGQFNKGFKHPPKRIIFDLDLLKNEYLSGKSTTNLSKQFNATQKTIYNRLKEIGVEIRHSLTEEQKKKISNTCKRKGIKPLQRYKGKVWNKGLNGEEYLIHYKDKKIWNKDKKGFQKSEKKGKTYEELYGKEKSNKFKEIIKQRRKTQVLPLKDSTIEVKIQNFLKELNIEFETHKPLDIKHSYQCDIFIRLQKNIPKVTIIECDGCYWHGCPECNKLLNKVQKKQIQKDNKRRKEICGKGYRIIRLKECKIKSLSLENFRGILF